MSFSALRVWSPYSGNAAAAVSGAGNGAANRVAIWASGTQITSDSKLTYSAGTLFVGAAAGAANIQIDGASGSNANLYLGTGGTRGWRFAGDGAGNALAVIADPDNTNKTVATVTTTGNWTLGVDTNSTLVLKNTLATNGADTLTLANGPTGKAGNPAGYLLLNINGTNRNIPFW